MTVEQLTALVIAVGSAPVILKAFDWIRAVRTGKASAEKRRNRMALNELEETRDYLRIMQEHASRLRRLLIELGYPIDKLPIWPSRNTKENAK